MISSVAIAPGDPGSGVKANIKDYNGSNNITQVTSQQYAMVAQMAGVTDVSIVVTANRPVSGESALTGVYKGLSRRWRFIEHRKHGDSQRDAFSDPTSDQRQQR